MMTYAVRPAFSGVKNHLIEVPIIEKDKIPCMFFMLYGKAFASAYSRSSNVIFARTGLIIPLCGVPASVVKSCF